MAERNAVKNEEGRYIYGVMAANHRQEFGPLGVGGRGDIVYTLPYRDIAAIISSSPIVKYEVDKANTTTHARVLEEVAKQGPVLPVRFGTIAENEQDIIEKVLKDRYQEFSELLRKMEGKVELGVRARWKDQNAIFAEVVEENQDIKNVKEALLKERNIQKKYAGNVKIGEMVQKELEEKKKREAEALLAVLRPLSLEWRENPAPGDMNLVNAAFLVAKEKESEFDKAVIDFESAHSPRLLLKYTAALVPYNFVQIVIHL